MVCSICKQGGHSKTKCKYRLFNKEVGIISSNIGNITVEWFDVNKKVNISDGLWIVDIYKIGKYIGNFKNGMFNGKGKMIYNNDFFLIKGGYIYRSEKLGYYQGDWINGKRDGIGTLCSSDSCESRNFIYVGEWKDDMKHGNGIMYYGRNKIINHLAKYDGSWKAGMRHGKGTYTFPDGSFYEGEWEEDVFKGNGKITFIYGTILLGDWSRTNSKNQKIQYDNSNPSSMSEKSRRIIRSNFNINRNCFPYPKGKVTFIFPNGNKYETIFNSTTMSHESSWEKYGDQLSMLRSKPTTVQCTTFVPNKGIYTFKNGDVFDGKLDIKEYYINGGGLRILSKLENIILKKEGTFIKKGEFTFKGKWINSIHYEKNRLVETTWRDGYGVLVDNKGNKYEGNWKQNKRSGKGKQIYANGDVYDGGWHDDLKHGKGILYDKYGVKYEGEWITSIRHGLFKITEANGDINHTYFEHGKINDKKYQKNIDFKQISKDFFGDSCSICKKELKINNLVSTACGHVFHLTCFLKSWKVTENCPVCKTHIDFL